MSYYKKHIFFCTNLRDNNRKCCQAAGASELRDYAKARIKTLGLSGKGGIRINTAGCMDRCALGPVMAIYPDAIWYTYQNKDDVDEILQAVVNGKVVNRLLLDDSE